LTAINIQPDATYGIKEVSLRFTTDGEIPMAHLMVRAYEEIKRGIERWTLVNPRDTFFEKGGIKLRRSAFQGDPDLLHFATTKEGRPINGQNRWLKEGLVDWAVDIKFIGPLAMVIKNEFREIPNEDEGFKSFDALPADLKEILTDKVSPDILGTDRKDND
jgi:hypothetical protein